jgi:hypothetical protein
MGSHYHTEGSISLPFSLEARNGYSKLPKERRIDLRLAYPSHHARTPPHFMPLILYCTIVLAGGLGLLLILQKKRRASMLPPGPPGDPLVGHLLRMPSTDSALVFHEWAKTYGALSSHGYINRMH